MKFKLLCSDLDGTLLTTKSDVSESTITEISRIKNTIAVVLVSARMPKGMRYLQKRLDIEKEPIICYNGGLILNGNEIIFSKFIPIAIVEAIFLLAHSYSIKLGLYYQDEWYVEDYSERVEKEIKYTKVPASFQKTTDTIALWKKRDVGAHKIMLMCSKASADAIFPTLIEKFGSHIICYRSNDTLIEIAPKGVSKLSAINIVRSNRFSLEEVIAFGDNYNDIEMLTYVGCGVAVGNARDEVKAIANVVTLPNTSNGVAHFIRKHL